MGLLDVFSDFFRTINGKPTRAEEKVIAQRRGKEAELEAEAKRKQQHEGRLATFRSRRVSGGRRNSGLGSSRL